MAKRWTTSLIDITTGKLGIKYRDRSGRAMHGLLRDGKGNPLASIHVENDIMRIQYSGTIHGDKFQVDEDVRLEWLPCYFGGERVWFRCPWCGERCGTLYLGRRVACRRCQGLVYRCQYDRDVRGWKLYWRWHMDERPRYMHWNRFLRMQDKAERRCLSQIAPLLSKWRQKGC